jgi:hypothetical protein
MDFIFTSSMREFLRVVSINLIVPGFNQVWKKYEVGKHEIWDGNKIPHENGILLMLKKTSRLS